MDIKVNHDGLLNLEQPMVKVPIEQLKKLFRNSQKHIEREMGMVATKASEMMAKGNYDAVPEVIARLQALKKRLKEARTQEELFIKRSSVRLDYLTQVLDIQTVDSDAYDRWSKIRLNHLICDYLSRHGFTQSAEKLSQDALIEDLVDLELFQQAQKIQTSLTMKNCSEALQWCADNKSALKKIKSSLEFQLRLQEYIELVRERKILPAIQYSKKYLVSWSDTHLKEIQQASGLLAFEPTTECHVYKALFDGSRWQQLIEALKIDIFTLNSLTKQPMLHLTLQAGLTALKTHSCYNLQDKNVNCPVCASDSFGILAEPLPNAHHVNSALVCRISGKMMDESNPPLVLPNGYVYSTLALKEMQERDGMILCPRSNNTYSLSETRKAYIS
ncbi:GID complex subunit containing RING finger motif [Kappamyces sp. JEL0680]|nr:GID complex subunit containing RING finger motif [Kappamyces sp. JEL0680]